MWVSLRALSDRQLLGERHFALFDCLRSLSPSDRHYQPRDICNAKTWHGVDCESNERAQNDGNNDGNDDAISEGDSYRDECVRQRSKDT